LQLKIISLCGEEWSGAVREVTLPGRSGHFGVLVRHAPLLALLREGFVRIHPLQGEPLDFYVSGGFAEVQPFMVIVLADLVARSSDLDEARAEAARSLADSPMASNFTGERYAQLHDELSDSLGASRPRRPIEK
jgi:F-type H+-transporting ATPase subunit epsilon